MGMVLFLSDLHVGQHHEEFNPKIARQRICSIVGKLPKEAPETLVVAFGGDIIEGSDIYLRQNAMIQFGARQQSELAEELLTICLDGICEKYSKSNVIVRWVAGNHGRTSLRSAYDDNWDIVIGRHLKEAFKKQARMKFTVQTNQPHDKFKVNGCRFYMIHKTARRDIHLETNARKGVILERLSHHKSDVMLLGHYHVGKASADVDDNLRLVVNGALGGSDPFYSEEGGFFSPPKQALIQVPKGRLPRLDDVQWLRW